MRALRSVVLVFAMVVGVPLTALAQASLTGVVRDTSGAILPGVTVEAASPVLIEKVRTGVTDGTGRYVIIDLRPGTYTVTFTLASFSVVKREAVELTGTAATTVNADLRVGTLQETVTVTGETPTVDVQSSTRVAIIDKDLIDVLPTSRNAFSLGVLIPGMNVRDGFGPVTDVGGATGPSTLALNIHGGKTEDQRLMVNGVALSTMIGGGWGGGAIPNATGMSEIAYDYSAVDAQAATGGVRINFIPRDGGNRFSGTIAGNVAVDGMQPDTFRKVTRGSTTFDFPDPVNPAQRIGFRASTVKRNGEFNPGFGGPFVQDKLWYFASGRYQVANEYITGGFHNKNAANPNATFYDPDFTRPQSIDRDWKVYQLRLTWQAAERHKIGLTYDYESTCTCNSVGNALTSPEASTEFNFPLQRFVQLDWNSPVSNRLLLDASVIHRVERWGGMHLQIGKAGVTIPDTTTIGVNDTGTGRNFRAAPGGGGAPYNTSWNVNLHYRAALSYVTGSHQFKVGFNNAWGHHENTPYPLNTALPYTYQFTNGFPSNIRQFATPYTTEIDVDADLGIFAQDKWTVGRATIAAAVRYDYFANSYPPQTLGPGPLVPGRNLTFDDGTYDRVTGLLKPGGTPNGEPIANVSWHDVTPRLGLTWDLFGTGKTALKTSLNKYLIGLGTFSFAPFNSVTSANNPINRLQNNTTRTWIDNGANGGIAGDFVPQCVLSNLLANGECGAGAPSFGQVNAPNRTYDPSYLEGWGNRHYNWEFSLGVQHELAPRVSAEVSYFRRLYGNFTVENDLAYSRSDFKVATVTAPNDPRLPESLRGQQIRDVYYYDGPPRQSNWRVGLVDQYGGKQIEHWDGVDVTANARLRNGLTIQGGLSTGRTLTDNCDLARNPELAEINGGQLAAFGLGQAFFLAATPLGYCHRNEGFITQYKAFATYMVPRIEVQISGTYQGLPGPLISANYTAPEAPVIIIIPGVFSLNKTVQIIEPGSLYGDRVNQFDFRISKLLRFAGTRTMVGLDIYNLLNSNPVLSENAAMPAPPFAGFRQPLSMLQARFFKFSAQFDW